MTSLRLPLPQEAGAHLYGATLAEVSREVRRVRPVLQAALPCPAVWEHLAAGAARSLKQGLGLEQLGDRRAPRSLNRLENTSPC